MSRHTRTVQQTYFICDICGNECQSSYYTFRPQDEPEQHACRTECAHAMKACMIAKQVEARRKERRAKGDGE